MAFCVLSFDKTGKKRYSDNSVNSGTSGIPLIVPLHLRVILGFRKPCFFTVYFRHPEVQKYGSTELRVRQNSVQKSVTHCLTKKWKYFFQWLAAFWLCGSEIKGGFNFLRLQKLFSSKFQGNKNFAQCTMAKTNPIFIKSVFKKDKN